MLIDRIETLGVKILGVEKIKKIKYLLSFIYYPRFRKIKNEKKIVYMLTPVHGNMGDQAIAIATKKYIEDQFSDYTLIEVYRKDTYKYCKAIKRILNENDMIFLHGGGNMGNIWIKEEQERRFIIKTFSNNKIISMPQTMSFSNDDDGIKELEITKKIYSEHRYLTILAREEKSYELMKKNFCSNVRVWLNPDMVLYLSDLIIHKDNKRTYIMTCFRKDKEDVFAEEKEVLNDKLKKNFSDVFAYDTVINKEVYIETRESELEIMLNNFLNSKVVITDRLHGMIFCVLTKTPCIVTKSLDHKINETYKWIKDLNYIKFVNNLDYTIIKPIIYNLINLDNKNYIDFYENYFKVLREKIL